MRDGTGAMSDDGVLFERRGAVGLITLNRPKALNALTLGMVRAIAATLTLWAGDAAISVVVVQGAGGRAFCAGGDIRLLYELGRAGRFGEALVFWQEEYLLNLMIRHYPKPYVSLIDGIVMGGGVGLSAHGSHRIASAAYLFAMPEVGIGFFPDVGATYVLPRLPGRMGSYLALTGARIGAGDACALGLATHAVPADRFAVILDRLSASEPVDAVLSQSATPPADALLAQHREVIDAAFAEPDLAAIVKRLDELGEAGSAFAAETAATMRSKSPTSMAIALEQMRRGVNLTFEAAMALEYRIVSRIGAGVDFYEGVRAVLIDRDQTPRWMPAAIDAVEAETIAGYFQPLPGGELEIAASS